MLAHERLEAWKLCHELVLKSDADYGLTYTKFLATDEEPLDSALRTAAYTVSFIAPQRGLGLGFDSLTCDVLVVEETATHYRLRFARQFAAEHPSLCNEWVSKESDEPSVVLKQD